MASAQAGNSADWASVSSSSLDGARSNVGKTDAKTVAPALGSRAKVANRRCSAVRLASFRCNAAATKAGWRSRYMRTRKRSNSR